MTHKRVKFDSKNIKMTHNLAKLTHEQVILTQKVNKIDSWSTNFESKSDSTKIILSQNDVLMSQFSKFVSHSK